MHRGFPYKPTQMLSNKCKERTIRTKTIWIQRPRFSGGAPSAFSKLPDCLSLPEQRLYYTTDGGVAKQQTFIPQGSGSWKSKIKVPAPGEELLPLQLCPRRVEGVS